MTHPFESVGDLPTAAGGLPPDDLTASRPAEPVPALASVEPPPGFRIERELGVGGMGAVYLARQTGLNRPVALKLVRAGEKADAKALIRFLAEAEAVASVRHPNVVEVYSYGEHDGRPYLALEFCGGGDLTALTAAPPARDAGWFRRVADLMAGVAAGVQAAHAAGIVHRDLKPGNVLLAADGTPKVADFGLAKRGVGSDLTRTHAVMGTPAYMSPEQAGGGGKFVGPEADVWALGVMLYELACGERPFDGGNVMEVLASVAAASVPPLRSKCPAVPPDLALVAHKCLQKEPKDRYPTAGPLAADLRNWLDGKPLSARPAGAFEQAVKWAKRNKKVAGMGLAVLLTMATATAVSLGFGLDADEQRRQVERQKKLADEQTIRTLEQKELADDRLWYSLVSQAGLSRAGGDRDGGLALLKEAAVIRAGPELVREAVQTLLLPELRRITVIPASDRRPGDLRAGEKVWRCSDLLLSRDGHALVVTEMYSAVPKGGRPRVVYEPAFYAVPSGRFLGTCPHRVEQELFSTSSPFRYSFAAAGGRVSVTDPQARSTTVWEPEAGRTLGTFPTGPQASLSPAGGVLAGYGPNGLRVWDVATGKERELAAQPAVPQMLAEATQLRLVDETSLLFVPERGEWAVWDVREGKAVRTGEKGEWVSAVSADGRTAAVQTITPPRLAVRDLTGKKPLQVLADFGEDGDSPNFPLGGLPLIVSAAGERIAFHDGMSGGEVMNLWDRDTRSLNRLSAKTSRHDVRIIGRGYGWSGGGPPGGFSPDARFLAAYVRSDLAEVRVWDAERRAALGTLPDRDNPTWGARGRLAVQNLVMNGSVLEVWEVTDPTRFIRLGQPVLRLAVGPRAVAASTGNQAELVGLGGELGRRTLDRSARPIDPPFTLFVGPQDEVRSLRGAGGGDELELLFVHPRARRVVLPNPQPHRRAPEGAALSPDGRWLAVLTEPLPPDVEVWNSLDYHRGFSVEVWDVSGDTPRRLWRRGLPTIPTKKRDGEEKAFAAARGELLRHFTGRPRAAVQDGVVSRWAEHWGSTTFTEAVFSADGRTLAVASADVVIQWDAESGAGLDAFVTAGSQTLATTPDLRRCYRTGKDGFFLWPVGERTPTNIPAPAHPRGITALAVSRDGRALASGGQDGSLCLWELHERPDELPRPVLDWPAHAGEITALAFTVEGDSLLVGTSDGLLKCIDLRPVREGLQALGLSDTPR